MAGYTSVAPVSLGRTDAPRLPRVDDAGPLPVSTRTVALLAGVCLLDGIDTGLIASSLRAMEASLGLQLSTLAQIEVAASIAGAVAMPLWALAVDAQLFDVKPLLVHGP